MDRLLIVFLILANCPLVFAEPDWLYGSSKKYPFETHMIGVGRGDDQDAARDNARAELSKIFEVNISSTTQSLTKALTIINAKGTGGSSESSFDEVTKTTTSKTLEGVIIPETYKKEKVWYALAVLERAKAKNRLMERIAALDAEAQAVAGKADSSTEKLDKLKHLKRAIRIMLEREAANVEYRVIGKQGVGIPATVELSDLTSRVDNLLYKDFRIGLEISGAKTSEVVAALSAGLAKAGFVLAKTGDKGDLLIKGSANFEEAKLNSPEYKFMRFSGSFSLVSVKDGSIISTVSSKGREGHLSLQEAENKALQKLISEIQDEVAVKLAAFIFGEAEKGNSKR